MGKSIQVSHRSINYKSQTDFKEYANQLIYDKIGLCENIKDTEYYDELLDLLKRHPQYKNKTENMTNLAIRRNTLKKKGFAIWIIKHNDELDVDISWAKQCITQNSNSKDKNLTDAFRSSIHPQTIDFRNKNLHICEKCNQRNNIHVDHIIKFHVLKNDFLKKYKKNIIPYDFDDMKDTTGRTCFKEKDKQFEIEWQIYHKDNAKLRILCEKCNLTRKK